MRFYPGFGCLLLVTGLSAIGCGSSGDSSTEEVTPSGSAGAKSGAAGAAGKATAGQAGAPQTGGSGGLGNTGGKAGSGTAGKAGGSGSATAGGSGGNGQAGTTAGGSGGNGQAGTTAGGNNQGGKAGSAAAGAGGAAAAGAGGAAAGGNNQGGNNQGGNTQGGAAAGGNNQGGNSGGQGGDTAGGSNQGGNSGGQGGDAAGGSNQGGNSGGQGGDAAGGSNQGGNSGGQGGDAGAAGGVNCTTDADCDDKDPCTTEVCAGGKCLYSQSNAPGCVTTVCGNGIIEGNEQCDDGNMDNTDTCTDACKLFVCGDGFTQPGNNEECDDGNQDNSDACTVDCQKARCGDGYLQPGEECDDQNNNDLDACNNSCKKTFCGDGILQAGEICDDGNQDNSDGCTNACQLPSCGDGFVQAGEQCDDGNAVDLDACSNACTKSFCGDGIQQLSEQCDDGNASNNDQCTTKCTSARCGDSFLQPGEACDDGNNKDGDGCSKDCKQESCGDGIKQPGEACDDGNQVNNDGCTNKCTLPACGDGILQPGEECDDGNSNNNDACTNACKNPVCGDGFVGPGEECDDANQDNSDYCVQGCKAAKCGDGFVLSGIEQCDDKNTNEFDGCTSKCRVPGTVDGPFDPTGEGSSGVKLDPNGNIIIDPNTSVSKKTSPLIWVANSQEGTISKIDTKTLQEVGRYCTAPGCKGDPSRTTIGLSGDAVVANRGGGSMVKIASDIASCVDRNGNGKIDTWNGVGPVPAQFVWQAGQPFSPDECVLWWTDLKSYNNGASPYPRAAGFDAEIGNKGELSVYVYIGLYSTGQLLRVEAATGKIVKVIKVPGAPYGLAIDKDGSVWIQSGSALVKVDVKNNDAVSSYPAQCMYGIATDPLGRVYTSGYGDQCVRRFDPVTLKSDAIPIGRNGGGVALDQNGHLWTGQPTGVRVDTNGPTLKILGTAKNGGHGWAIDYDNNPWSIPINGSFTAYKHDPSSAVPYNNQIAKPGAGTYTYSDMTGFQLTNAASKAGLFRKTFLGCGPNTSFDALSFDLTAPPNTTTTISVRVAPDAASLANAAWQKIATVPPSKTPVTIKQSGGAIQIELALQSKDLNVTPILSTLDVQMSNCAIQQ
jgi:cysteine-rich repeat protein